MAVGTIGCEKRISLCLAFGGETRPNVLARSAGLKGVQDESLGFSRWWVTFAFRKYLVQLVGSGLVIIYRAVQIFLVGGGILNFLQNSQNRLNLIII